MFTIGLRYATQRNATQRNAMQDLASYCEPALKVITNTSSLPVPDVQVPDVTVNEAQSEAEVCIEISNEIESSLVIQYTTTEVNNGANGL